MLSITFSITTARTMKNFWQADVSTSFSTLMKVLKEREKYLPWKGNKKKPLQMKGIFSHKQCQRRKENYINFLWLRFGPMAKLFDYLSVVHHVGLWEPSRYLPYCDKRERPRTACGYAADKQVSIDSLPQHWVRLPSSILLIIDEGYGGWIDAFPKYSYRVVMTVGWALEWKTGLVSISFSALIQNFQVRKTDRLLMPNDFNTETSFS